MTEKVLSELKEIAMRLIEICAEAENASGGMPGTAQHPPEKGAKLIDFLAFAERAGYKITTCRPQENPVASQPNKRKKALSKKEKEEMKIDLPGISVASQPRKDGRYMGYILVKGKRCYVYGKTKEETVAKIRRILKYGPPKKRITIDLNGIPQRFADFTEYYFEKFRKRKLAAQTYYSNNNIFKNYLKPFFGNKPIKEINPSECQNIIDEITNAGKGKTADETFSLLTIIFRGAISHGIITRNPMSIVYHAQHERKSGTALTSEEIAHLKTSLEASPLKMPFMILLYTGLRPNELKTVKIDGEFIVAVNSKRKTKRTEYKKIPICENLKPYLKEPLYLSDPDYLRRKFKEILPNHILYDLRTTFYTKCVECGVALPALKEFVGHSSGTLGNTYTDLSDEYLLKEGLKIQF